MARVSETPGTGETPAPPAPSAPRYQRSTGGLIGALLVTVVVILGFVAFRALNRDQPDVKPSRVDYLAAVSAAQGAHADVVYPPRLPRGWMATSVDYVPAERGHRPAWGIGMLTGSDHFVGVRQEDASLDDLLHTYVDENPTEGPTLTVPGSVARTWRSFSDSGGDHAYAAEVGHDNVLVYGSASTDDLRRVVDELSTAPR